VFGAIARFSEDVDVTLDYRGFDGTFDPFAEKVSKTRLRSFSDALKLFVRDHVHGIVVPYFRVQLDAEFGQGKCHIEISDDGEQLRVHYPSALESDGDYVSNSVLLEFGGRNITEPNEEHAIRPDIAPFLTNLAFPEARVDVLVPARTFWEKATLMHVECQRGQFRANATRLSRHWYDLAMLADLGIGETALADRALLVDVVKHKKVFFNASYANYDACLTGYLRLLPDDDALIALRDDFQRMIMAGMFIGAPPVFEVIVERLRVLERLINSVAPA
jgi:hypothetical protein